MIDSTPPDFAELALVRAFCAAWDRLDVNAALEMLADDIHYHNITMPALDGIATVEGCLRQAAALDSAAWEIAAWRDYFALADDQRQLGPTGAPT